MFKKPVKVSAQNQLSGKDKKVTRSKLQGAFDNECIEKVFAANDKMICCKIAGSKMLLYNGEDYPLFIDGTGKHNYFPSLYLVAAYQPLIKTLIINEGVESYIYNGANLMWPGVRDFDGLGEFEKDQTVGIRNSKGEIIAIGAMGCSKKDLSDTSGVAVYILHYLGDKLWQMGPKTFPEVIVPLKVAEQKQQPKKQQTKVQEAVNVQQKTIQQKPKKQSQKVVPTKKKQKQPEAKQKSPEQSDQSQSDDDFMNLVHSKDQPQGRVVKMEPKANIKAAFIEDQNLQKNAKNKKKPQAQKAKQKGGKNKPQQSQSQQEKKPQQQKGKKKGGKNKKQQSEQDQDVMEEQQPQTKKGNQKDNKKGGKKGKQSKKPKKNESGSQNQDNQTEQKKQGKSDDQQKQQKGQQKSALNSKLMDEYFKESMLNAIKLSKVQAQLPIDSGKFYMDYMLLARPEGVKLEIKDSTYKKIGKFFEEMAKKKIIEYKHPKDKKAQGAMISKIFWQNEQLKNHVPTVKKMGSRQQQQKVQTYSKTKLKLSKTVSLETVYKPSQQLFNQVLKKPLNLMPAQGQKQVTDKQQVQFVTEKQLRQKIERYINKIVDGNKKQDKQGPKKTQKTIIIEYTKHQFLRDLLKKQIQEHEQNKQKDDILKGQDDSDDDGDKKKKKGKKGTGKQCIKIDRNYLVEKLMKKASPYYHLYDKQNDLDVFRQGTFKGIQLTAQKVANKNVTRIVGLDLFITPRTQIDQQYHGFANILQLKFACSVNVQNLPGKNAGKQIIVHGAFLDQLEQMLTTQYQLGSKFITTLNKLDKKKKT